MAEIFQTGVSGLLAAQRSLATTSHNIANADTEGFSRQRVQLDARRPELRTAGYIGNGVRTTTVVRLADEFLIGQVRTGVTNHSRSETFHEFASQVSNLLGTGESGISAALQEFFNGIQSVADDPASIPARQVMLSESGSLVNRFHDLAARFEEIKAGINTRLRSSVDDINAYATQIADLNKDIVIALGRSQGKPPNDLLDKRDLLVEKLAELVGVQTFEQDDGAMNVIIGNGQTLVVGNQSVALTLVNDPADSTRKQVAYDTGGVQVIISDSLTSGRVGGMLEFRRDLLEPTQNSLGRLAAAIGQSFNLQHRDGMDLNGALGTNYFALPPPRVLPAVGNTGSISVAFNENDVGGLAASDYALTHDGVNFTLRRLSDNTTQTLAGAGPFNVDGLTITVGAAPAAGDSYTLQPMRDVAQKLALAVSDPERIAAAIPVRTEASFGNLGNGRVSAGTILDVTNANLLNTVTLDFNDPPTTFQVNGAGPLMPYTPGGNIDINGWRVQISAQPLPGDQFVVESNAGGVSDNSNALALADLRLTDILDAGTATYQDSYGQMVADVGTRTRQSEISTSALSAMLLQANAARDQVSGVNLDEEAANLLQLQQLYQASAQVIATADAIFQDLLAAVRR